MWWLLDQPPKSLYPWGGCRPKQGKLLRNIWSLKIINCLESPFFSVSESIHQRLIIPCCRGQCVACSWLVITVFWQQWLMGFSRESHAQLPKLSHWTITSNNLYWYGYTQRTFLGKGKGKVYFLFTKMKYLNSHFCICVDNRDEGKWRNRREAEKYGWPLNSSEFELVVICGFFTMQYCKCSFCSLWLS